MTPRPFEIRVALVGYVSVGKSTVLNALLGDRFSQVSMRRTTAGVNLFRIANNSSTANESVQSDNGADRPAMHGAAEAHEEITHDNQLFRSSDEVHEKVFNIELDEPICEMRDDTQLALIDIPGINEADSSSKYKEYVTKNWNTFDCVVVVMDAIQGVNTEEQVELLRFVKRNNQEKKDLPTIILGNKMDDPDDEEEKAMVAETHSKVVEIFGTGCSEDSLTDLLQAANNSDREVTEKIAFIPISAMFAFVYRMAAHLSFEEFEMVDKNLLDKIGCQEVGRKWKKMPAKAKYKVISEAVSDPQEYKERLSSSNFDTFLSVLAYFVGGKVNQTALLKQQLQVKLNLLAPEENLVDQVKAAHTIAETIGEPVSNLPDHFWRVYAITERNAIFDFSIILDPSALKRPFFQIVNFLELAKMYKWDEEVENVVPRAAQLLGRQLSLVTEKGNAWNFMNWYNKAYRNGDRFVDLDRDSWDNLSPEDWVNLLSAVLLVANDHYFVEHLGKHKIALDRLLHSFTLMSNKNSLNFSFGNFCENCCTSTSHRPVRQYHFATMKNSLSMLNPDNSCPSGNRQCSQFIRYTYFQALSDPATKEIIAGLKVPERISSPSHWGHLSWEFVRLCRKVEKN